MPSVTHPDEASIGKHLTKWHLTNGEEFVDLPPKMYERIRVFSTGQGRTPDDVALRFANCQ